MKLYKKILLALPEYLLITSVLFYWISTGLALNFIAISLLTIIISQIIIKNKVIGIIIPSLLIILSLYMILAVISEVREFPSFNVEARTLLAVGLAYFLTTILISIIMIYKYVVLPTKSLKT